MNWFKKKTTPLTQEIRVMVIKPKTKPEVIMMKNSLHGLREIMGEYQLGHIIEHTNLHIFFVPAPFNKELPETALVDGDMYRGDLLIIPYVKSPESGESIAISLTDEEIEYVFNHVELVD